MLLKVVGFLLQDDCGKQAGIHVPNGWKLSEGREEQ
jgi:hypothetical protein